ncbi:MAG: hypothetical protein SPE36_02610 [Lactobacillus johnsonii]|nr:hypothetical protein [Lactobacillus johnsonii]
MWVRSQNKRFLGNYDSFAVSESGKILGYQGPEDFDGIVLGVYKSEEIALMVLDDMQGYIVHLGAKNLITQFVFEMPIGSNKEVLSNGNWI